MSPLNLMINEYLSRSAGIYFVRQLVVILAIFVFGAILTEVLLPNRKNIVRSAAVAFPVGLSAFAVTAYAMLTFNIPYNTYSVTAALIIEGGATLIVGRKSFATSINRALIVRMLIVLGVAAVAASVACSGLIPVFISNDTMYYFKRYPESIVHYGALRDQFDSWLTDTGLGSVCLDTLPSLFGFGESFGIREFFHMSFLTFFGTCVYERAGKHVKDRFRLASALIVTAVLAVATPFAILGHWALANMYFMELFFIAAYTAYDEEIPTHVSTILLLALALLRIEGTLFAVWLVICVAYYKKTAKKLALCVLIPLAVLFSLYCRRIFCDFYIFDDIYVFLTPQKAVVLIGIIVAAAIFLLFIFDRIPAKLAVHLPKIYVLGAIAANLVIAVRNSELYLGNLATFATNLFGQSGWGMFPHLVVTSTILLAAEYLIMFIRDKKKPDPANGFNITLTVGFVLMALVASFGRGDALSDYIGDSGNRVMLQVVPLVVIMYTELFMGLLKKED